MKVIIEGGLEPSQEGFETQERMRRVFETCLKLAGEKQMSYGTAWRQQGWMGNLARIQSKVSRLKNMLWRDFPLGSTDEPIEDTALDMINLTAFFLINVEECNRWGQ